jgi:hypothetical protein
VKYGIASSYRFVALGGIFVFVLFVCGCGGISVKKCGIYDWHQENNDLTFDFKNLTLYTYSFLVNNQLYDKVERDPEKVIRLLYGCFRKSRERKFLRILAEICFYYGVNNSNDDRKIAFYGAACYFSYLYLFDREVYPKPRLYSPDIYIMTQYYNSSLAEIFLYLDAKKLIMSRGFCLPEIAGVKLCFEKPLYELFFPYTDKTKIRLCYNYLISGLKTYSHYYGVGVPLFLVTSTQTLKPPFLNSQEQTLPGSLFMRLDKTDSGDIRARLEYYDTFKTEYIDVNKRRIPLELDYTTPLAYLLRRPTTINGLKYMFVPEDEVAGLFYLTPLCKDKIPVVLVHGLMSNPRTWAQMINSLVSDPELRHNYQFWFYAYPTGNPVLYSARKMRQSLEQTKRYFKGGGENAFKHMVIVAHSMGGLLSKTTIMNSGSELVMKVFKMPLSKINEKLTPDQKMFVAEMMVFKRLPFVQRVIFLAVPHRGSEIATWTAVRWVAWRIALPAHLNESIKKVMNKMLVKSKLKGNDDPVYVATGLDNLDPSNRMLKALAALKFDPEVKYHTISGNHDEAGVPGGTDGVVPYFSSHLDGAVSELVVKSGHNVQENLTAIEEVRRILLLHLKENGLLKEKPGNKKSSK